MANPNKPFGLRPVRRKDGACWTGSSIVERKIDNGYNTAIFRGDLVIQLSTGYIARSAAAEGVRFGVFWGCFFTSNETKQRTYSTHYPAAVATLGNADIDAQIISDKELLFEIQGDSADGIERVEFEDIFANADIVATAGSTATGMSAETLDVSGIAVTATFPLRIHELHPADEDSAYRRALVSLNSLDGVDYLGV